MGGGGDISCGGMWGGCFGNGGHSSLGSLKKGDSYSRRLLSLPRFLHQFFVLRTRETT